jgi:tryptophan-rich sensory protein
MDTFWYDRLRQPPGTPPNWVFGVVWPILYFMIAISGLLCYQSHRSTPPYRVYRIVACICFCLQLVLNLIWSPIFFRLQAPRVALGVILLLWCTIAATIASFWVLHRFSALLLVPYLVWVTYAVYLNGGIVFLNK